MERLYLNWKTFQYFSDSWFVWVDVHTWLQSKVRQTYTVDTEERNLQVIAEVGVVRLVKLFSEMGNDAYRNRLNDQRPEHTDFFLFVERMSGLKA